MWALPKDPASVVSLLCFISYFLISRVVLSIFPFSTYSMYSNMSGVHRGGQVRGCHLLAVGPDARASDVTEFRAWDCPPWEDAARRSADELSCGIALNVEDPIREYIHRNAGHAAAAVRVDLVRRVWVFADGRPPTQSDHLVASCRAVLR